MKKLWKKWIFLSVIGSLLLSALTSSFYAKALEIVERWDDTSNFLCNAPIEAQEGPVDWLIQKKLVEANQEKGVIPYSPDVNSSYTLQSTGKVKVLVLPIMFADTVPLTESWEQDYEYYQRIFNADDDGGQLCDQSVHAAYLRHSYGRLDITADVLPLYFVNKTKEQFREDPTATTVPHSFFPLIGEALGSYGIDVSQYDVDGDGYLDCLCIIEGCGFLDGEYTDFTKTLTSNAALNLTYYDGQKDIKIGSQVLMCVKSPIDSSTYIHELGHCLGMDDHYFNIETRCYLPPIHHDMMAGRDSYFNVLYKYLLGWIDPIIVTDSDSVRTIELCAAEKNKPDFAEETNEAKAILYVPDATALPFTEFFIAEYRNESDVVHKNTGSQPGITLWHCDMRLEGIWHLANPAGYLQSVRPTGGETNASFTAADYFVPEGPPWNEYSESVLISPSSSPVSSSFFNGEPTKFYMEVLDQDEDKAVVRVGPFDGPLQDPLKITPVGGKIYGDKDFQLTTTGGSGTGAVTYEVLSGNALAVAPNGLVTIRNVGQSWVKATKAGDDIYQFPRSNSLSITVTPRNIRSVMIELPIEVYTGQQLRPIPSVMDNGRITPEDYDVSYGENIGPGEGTVTLTGKRNYTGSTQKAFIIAVDETIETPEELRQFAEKVNSGDGTYINGHFTLLADIDLGGSETPWTPISSNRANAFQGVFDGNGHRITGLTISDGSDSLGFYQGLFGFVGKNGIVQNLAVEGTVSGSIYVGGIVAHHSGTIQNCYNSCDVLASSQYVGGIAGGNFGTIENCYNIGEITGARSGVGGISGQNQAQGAITNCYNFGAVVGQSDKAGGIVGQNNASVTNCYYLSGMASGGIDAKDEPGAAEEKTAEQFQAKDSFGGWDFSNVWVMSDNLRRPILQVVPENEVHIHEYSSDWKSDGISHWHECECGDRKDETLHIPQEDPAVEPDCTTAGKAAGSHCSVCNYIIIPQTERAPTGHSYSEEWSKDGANHWHECSKCHDKKDIMAHTPQEDPAVEPDCTTAGKTAGSHCSVCSYIIVPQTERPAVGHSYLEEWSQDGDDHWHECSRCHDKKDIAPHVENGGTVTRQPTLGNTGIKTYACSTCGYVMRTEILPKLEPSHEHSYSSDWKSDGTSHWHECDCGERKDETTHVPQEDPAVEPNCITAGKTAGSHCSVCNYVITPQIEQAPTGHSYSEEWSKDGANHWHECSKCHDKKDIAPHTEDSGTVTRQPTLEDTGIKTYACSTCGYVMRTETLPKLEPSHEHSYSSDWKSDGTSHWHECDCGERADETAHIPQENPAVEPSCTTAGKTAGSHCSVCNYVITPQIERAPTGHSYSEDWSKDGADHWHECSRCHGKKDIAPHTEDSGTVTRQPTLEDTGVKTYACSTCGYVMWTETLPKLEPSHTHDYSDEWSNDASHHWHKCTGCEEITEQAAHTWDSGAVTTAPTSSSTGVKTYTCTVCKQIRTETIPSTGGSSSPSAGGASPSGGGSYGSSPTKYTVSLPGEAVGGSVRASLQQAAKGTEITLAVELEDGYELKEIGAKDQKGKSLELRERNGKYIFSMPASNVEITVAFREQPRVEVPPTAEKEVTPPLEEEPAPAALPFTDVSEKAWYFDAVAEIYGKGIMTGLSETQFGPEVPASRGMVVTMLWRMAGAPALQTMARFNDVSQTQYYAPAVAWAAAHGIVTGYEDGTFRPNSPITREGLAVILHRYMAYKGQDVTVRADLSSYTDTAQISSYAQESLSWAKAVGLISGTDWRGIHPGGNASRAETATMLLRAFMLETE